jgi:RNA polymerase sigma-70 factor (ECF subfamily)
VICPTGLNTEVERRLLAAARAGDELAFDRLTARYTAGLEFFCLLMLGCPQAAHEAVCETVLRGWRELGRVAPPHPARIWLYGLASDVCFENLEATAESRALRPFDAVRDTNEPSQ